MMKTIAQIACLLGTTAAVYCIIFEGNMAALFPLILFPVCFLTITLTKTVKH